jgi:cytochrome c-type biogenesis protein CcsB
LKSFLKIVPWLFLALFVAEIVAVFRPKKDGAIHIREFGRLPVLMEGRVQPFDSAAKNTLLQIRNTGDVPLEAVPSWKFWHHPKKLRATEWLAEVLFKPETADTRPIFLIHHPELLTELNLSGKGQEKSGLRYFSFNELMNNNISETNTSLREIFMQARQASQVEEAHRSTFQRQVLKVHRGVVLYDYMKGAVVPPIWDDFDADLKAFQASVPAGMEALQAREAGREHDTNAFARFWRPLSFFFDLSKDTSAGQVYPLVVPPKDREKAPDAWVNVPTAVLESVRDRDAHPPVQWLATAASGYRSDNAAQFNGAISEYKAWLAKHFPKELKKARHEFYYNDVKAFLHALIMNLFAFVLAAVSLLTVALAPRLSEALRRSAVWIVALGFVVHTFGLIFRMYLEGRPPVTNLYSSAIFIGWGAVVFGLMLERIYRVGIGVAVGSLIGAISLIIAHNLALGGDTMKMLQAVLDTNFWLATHVVIITLGYAATFVAGIIGIAYVLLGVFTPLLRQGVSRQGAVAAGQPGTSELGKVLARMAYAIICFATLFSFTGTVLGGIWADQSWGRFWGWDPKENGALIIVLWNAVVLHARWGGIARERGVMLMTIVGNIVTAWSWFGVNLLSIGLHSYGFMEGGAKWLYYVFVPTQLAIIALGLIPTRLWRSFRDPAGPGNTPKSPTVAGDFKPA